LVITGFADADFVENPAGGVVKIRGPGECYINLPVPSTLFINAVIPLKVA
jgi:hypothetical protein